MFTPDEAAEIVAAAGEKHLGEVVAPPPALSFDQMVELGGEFGLGREEVSAAYEEWRNRTERPRRRPVRNLAVRWWNDRPASRRHPLYWPEPIVSVGWKDA